jgi:hypothetical protein
VSEYHTFLNDLQESYRNSGNTLEQFVQSEGFERYYLKNESDDLINLKKQYSYVYDLFLIDLEGNILYTVDRESDLGQNAFHGKISNTKFAQAIRQTLDDKKDHFSDIEHYAASAEKTSGFLTTPLLDPHGKMIGIMAVQFEISTLLNFASYDRIKWYLVGNDGLLRSKIVSTDEILKRKINTDVYWKWYDEHGLFDKRKILSLSNFSVKISRLVTQMIMTISVVVEYFPIYLIFFYFFGIFGLQIFGNLTP